MQKWVSIGIGRGISENERRITNNICSVFSKKKLIEVAGYNPNYSRRVKKTFYPIPSYYGNVLESRGIDFIEASIFQGNSLLFSHAKNLIEYLY